MSRASGTGTLVIGVSALSVLAGVLIAHDASAVLLGALILALLATAALFPIWAGPGLYVAGIAVLSVFAVIPSTERVVVIVGGPARFTLAFACLLFIKLVVRREPVQIPSRLMLAVGAGILLVVFQYAIGLARGNNFAAGIAQIYSDVPPQDLLSEAARSAMYPLAAFVAAVSLSSGRLTDRRRQARTLSAVALVLYAMSVLYWLWLHGAPAFPGLSSVFARVSHTGGYADRSIFPFVTDSPNGNGIAFAMLAILVVALQWEARQLRRRSSISVLSGVVVAGAIAAVFTTESRTGLISLVAGLTLVLALMSGGGIRRTVVVGALLVGVVILVAPHVLPGSRQLSTSTPTLVARTQLWSRAWDAFKDVPIAGHGYFFSNSVTFSNPTLPGTRPAFATVFSAPAIAGTQNQYLAELADGGVLGLILFLIPFILVGRDVTRNLSLRAPLAMYTSVLAVVAVAAISTTVESSSEVWALLWLTLGWCSTLGDSLTACEPPT